MASKLVKTIAQFSTTLTTKTAVGATTGTLTSGLDIEGVQLPTGTYGFLVDRKNSSKEYFTATLTGAALTNIETVTVGTGVGTAGLLRTHRKGAEVIITDHVSLKRMMNVLDGTTNFDSGTPLGYDGAASITTANQFATKAYADGIAVAGGADSSTTVKGISKMSVAPASPTAPIAVGDNDYRVNPNNYAADAGANDTYVITLTNAPASYVNGQSFFFKANTINTGTATLDVNGLGPKTIKRSDGTTLLTGDIIANQRVHVQYDGTDMIMISSPAATVNLASGVYPAGDGLAITGLAPTKGSYTASGDIVINDAVYVSAANTVKSIYPSAMGTGTTISTSPGHNGAKRDLPLSTSGLYLHITGGDIDTALGLYAQVRTMNAAETDFANGSEQAIYTTGNGCRGYDVKSIGTDKFLFILQADTAGSGAGIKTFVATVSGTTVTVGTVQAIETLGQIDQLPSLAKLNTDKAIIFYNKDSDTFLYSQVLTVSGTTISTNTPAQVKAANQIITQAVQLGTDSAAVLYGNSNSALFGRTITVSSTTPTVNAEQTLVSGTSTTWKFGLAFISATKLLLAYSEAGTSTNDQLCHIALSGATMTKSSNISLAAARATNYFGLMPIGTKYALVLDYATATTALLSFVDISGTAPVSVSTQTLTSSNNGNLAMGYSVVKVAPWTYVAQMGGSGVTDGDFIVKLTVNSSARIGIAEAAISSAAAGYILYRYLAQTISSLTLTAGSVYYVDDTGQPTTGSSLTAPTLGVAISTTKILLQ